MHLFAFGTSVDINVREGKENGEKFRMVFKES